MTTIVQTSHITPVVNKIEKLKPTAPSNWADLVADKMGCSVTSVREYARGIKGARNGKTIQVLEHLIKIINHEKERIAKLTA